MLIEQQVTDGRSVSDLPKRVNILVSAAEFLWTLDPTTSRAYYQDAFATAGRHFSDKGFEETPLGKYKRIFAGQDDMRMVVIRSVATRDRLLAKKMIAELLAGYEKEFKDRSTDEDREPADLIGLAGSLAKTDPVLCKYLFERVMAYPLIQNWFFSLPQVAKSDQALGDSIYAEALRAFRNEAPSHLRYLSAYPFGSERMLSSDPFDSTTFVPSGFVPNEGLQIAFLNTFFDRVAVFTSDPEQLAKLSPDDMSEEVQAMSSALDGAEPVVIQKFPQMLPRFSLARSQAGSMLTTAIKAKMEGRSARSKDVWGSSFDERIKALEQAEEKGHLTDEMIIRASIGPSSPSSEEEFKRLQPWLDKIKESEARSEAMNYFWFQRSDLAIKEERFSDAEKAAAKVPELDHRSILLFKIAEKELSDANQSNSAFDILNTVSKTAHSGPDSLAKAQVLLGLALFYERVSHTVALDELGESVKTLNRLEDPNIFENWVYRKIELKDFSFVASISLPGVGFQGTFNTLGQHDFELALANAKALDDKYLRTLATIAIAKNCVQPPKLPSPKTTH